MDIHTIDMLKVKIPFYEDAKMPEHVGFSNRDPKSSHKKYCLSQKVADSKRFALMKQSSKLVSKFLKGFRHSNGNIANTHIK